MDTILVVEDERDIKNQIADLLESSGYKVDSVSDGKEAIDYLDHEIPDLVISDIMMPNVDGYQLLDYFQKLPATSIVPFIFITAKTELSELRKGMTLGADDYITKPFRAKELLHSVETQLKKKSKSDKKFEEICLSISAYVPHELRTPLIPIMGYTELMLEGLDELTKTEISDFLSKINFSVHRLYKVIEKFTRYTEAQLKNANRNCMASQYSGTLSIASDIEITARKLMMEQNRYYDLTLNISDAEINISRSDFQFIVEELVTNACKFSNPGTAVFIKSEIVDNYYVIEITDHGRGMTPEQVTDISPFVQHERKQYQQSGNGLGLATVKKIVEYYGGEFKIYSEKDLFTTCKLSFPLSEG